MLFSSSVRDNRADTEQYTATLGRYSTWPCNAGQVPISRLMVRVLMAFLATGEARHGNFVSALLRDVVRLDTFSPLANGVPCRFCSVVAALCSTCRACSRPVSVRPVTASVARRSFRRHVHHVSCEVVFLKLNFIEYPAIHTNYS